MLHALLATLLAARASACSFALDCFLNGDCVGGACVCDTAWSGAACSTLVTGPATQL